MSENDYNYGTYSSAYYGTNENYATRKPEEPKTPKKKGGFFKKVMTSIFLGLLFGGFAAVGFWGVQKGTEYVDHKQDAFQQEVAGAVLEDHLDTPVQTPFTREEGIRTDLGNGTTYEGVPVIYDTSVENVVDLVMPSMVSISKNYYQTYQDFMSGYSFFFGGGGQETKREAEAQGSGIIIGETETEYLIVTNNHVVEDPISLAVTFVDGTTAEANIKGLNSSRDLAVIAVQKANVEAGTKNEIRIARIGDSDALRLGEKVVAIGNALGYGQSVTTGIVSALDRTITTEDGAENTYIQTDAAINGGNSGGALLNMAGQVIGINSVKIASSSVEGMGYAIPISQVGDILSDLMVQTTKIKVDEEDMGYLGISGQDVTEALSQRYSIPVGIYVVEAIQDGAAQAAGLQAGDVIVEFDGSKVSSFDDLKNILQYYRAGTTVSVTYKRMVDGQYESNTVNVTLGERPKQ